MGSLYTFDSFSKTLPATKDEKDSKDDKFAKVFQELLDLVSAHFSEISVGSADIQETLDWLSLVLNYNAPDGKQLRGRMVEHTYKLLVANPTEENLKLARVLGWIVEILQAACLIADDVMDDGITRRGKPCWHHVDNLGNMAFNDTLLLEHYALQLLRIHFGNIDTYSELVDLVHDVSFKTALGQSLDLRTGKDKHFKGYTTSLYHSIVTFKTAYYTIYFPVALALIFAGVAPKNPEYRKLWKKVEETSVKIGQLFQIQDDFFDCYANEQVLGKVGTDIGQGKCSWLFVTAKEKCTADELQELLDNYGWDDTEKVAKVKDIYNRLRLPKIFSQNQKQLYTEIINLIRDLNHGGLQTAFLALLHKIYRRSF